MQFGSTGAQILQYRWHINLTGLYLHVGRSRWGRLGHWGSRNAGKFITANAQTDHMARFFYRHVTQVRVAPVDKSSPGASPVEVKA